mmetsp:Transcript_31471/g.77517  ORF Transcript_31471/g.77517 Transcript_31471/m.77517 type:complete len:265 (-) Transcript_31471:1627-2421(-)
MPVLQNSGVARCIVASILKRTDEVDPVDDLWAGRARAAAKNRSVRRTTLEAGAQVLRCKGTHSENHHTLVRTTQRVDITVQTALDRATEDVLAWQNHLTRHTEATVGAEHCESTQEREQLLCARAGQHPATALAEHALHLGLHVDSWCEIMLLDTLQRIAQDLAVVAVVGVRLLTLHKPVRGLRGVDARERVAIMAPSATSAVGFLEDSKRVSTGGSKLGSNGEAGKASANDDDLGLSGQGGAAAELVVKSFLRGMASFRSLFH